MFIGDQLYRLPNYVNNNNELVLCVVVEDNIGIRDRCKFVVQNGCKLNIARN